MSGMKIRRISSLGCMKGRNQEKETRRGLQSANDKQIRFKAEMWSKVAEEMAIPWRAAEAMHWQLGEQEMARRAGVVPFSLSSAAIDPPTTRTRRASTSFARPRKSSTSRAIPGHLPGLPTQLPSLEELTAGVPAYAPPAPPPPREFYGVGRPPDMGIPPPGLMGPHLGLPPRTLP